jgi:hypothetical protein
VWRRVRARLPAGRRERIALGLLGLILLAGAGVRLWLLTAQRPALIGYPDSYSYVSSAMGPLFSDPLRQAGYPYFLGLVKTIDSNLSATIVAQHALGLASALLLYLAARRVGLSRWWSLLPAGVLALSGPQVMIEHAVLTEPLFVFLQSASVYAAVRAVGERDWAWALGAGLFAGATVTVRTLGLLLAGVVILWLALASTGAWRRRLVRATATLATTLLVAGAYVAYQESETGYTGLTPAGAWNLYGRVAPFADCERFTPPEGTRRLCERTPEEERPGPTAYIFGSDTPALKAFGGPFVATEDQNESVAAFARAAIVNQPLDWLDHVVTEDLVRYVASDRTVRETQGLSFDGLQMVLVSGPDKRATAELISTWYSTRGEHVNEGRLDAFFSYERATRVVGPLFVLLVLLGVAGLGLARGEPRRGAWLFAAVALVSIIGPVATLFYDARYAIPAFGPLAAAAAVGGWAVTQRAAGLRRRGATAPVQAPPGPR